MLAPAGPSWALAVTHDAIATIERTVDSSTRPDPYGRGMATTPMLAAVLAGGGSTRMGRDKATLPWRGGTLLGHVCAVAREAGLAVAVVGRAAPAGFRTIADELPGEGPLAALATVLAAHDGAVLLLACDLPRLDAEAVRWLAALPCGADGAVLEIDGRLQTCCAIYHQRCLPAARARLAEGRRSLHALVEAGDFARNACPPALTQRFVDVDTEEEWGRALGP